MDKTVAILVSTYNGEKYIKEQLDSILNQTYQNIHIYVRDDGSTDSTIAILKEYEQNPKIQVCYGKNIGFVKSFFALLEMDKEAQYYAFSDQDDVWEKEKIEKQVNKIQKEEEEKGGATACFTNYDYYDSNLTLQQKRKAPDVKPSFRNSMVDCIAMGMNLMINRETRDKIVSNVPKFCYGHDSWVYMICSEFGSMVEIKEPLVRYRRHDQTVSAGGMNFFKFQWWRIKKFFGNHYFGVIKAQLCEYERIFGQEMKEADRKLLQLFTGKFRLSKQIKKVCYTKRFRTSLIDEIFLRIIFLIGAL